MRKSIVVALSAIFVLAAAPAAHAGEYYNDYTVSLPDYVTGATPFTVTVDGPDAVCGMTLQGVTVSAAPWNFVYDPAKSGRSDAIDVTYCDGETDSIWIQAQTPFYFSPHVLSRGGDTVLVQNTMEDVAANVTLTRADGTVVSQTPLPANENIDIKVPSVKKTETMTVTAVSDNGLSMSHKVIVPKGWAYMTPREIWQPCQNIKWFYDSTGQPKSAKTTIVDVRGAVKILDKETNLTFTEVDSRDKADVVYYWDSLGKHGASAMGGYQWSSNDSTTGTVQINKQDWWPRDKYSGFGAWKYSGTGPGGRGWLYVHETMHVLGFDHVSNTKSIMAPVNGGQHAFTKADLTGLHTMFPQGTCPA